MTTPRGSPSATALWMARGRASSLPESYTNAWDTTDEAGDRTRAIYINAAVASLGTPFAFTVNVGPTVITAAARHPRGFLDHLRRRVVRELKVALGRDASVWVVVVTTDTGKPHLHGAIALENNDNIVAVHRALTRAGGAWRTTAADYQTDLAPTRHPDTWATYPFKRAGQTRRHLRELAGLAPTAKVTILSVSADLRAEAKRLHEVERRVIGRPAA